jgi:hypothetical protein
MSSAKKREAPVAKENKTEKKQKLLPLKEEKEVWVVQFDGLEDECTAPNVIGREDACRPIITATKELAERAKEERINLVLDTFYQTLREQKYEFRDKVPVAHPQHTWLVRSALEVGDDGWHFPVFSTLEEAKDFIKLLTMLRNDEKPTDLMWVRGVCQSYLRLRMSIVKGSFMGQRKEEKTQIPHAGEKVATATYWNIVESKERWGEIRNTIISLIIQTKRYKFEGIHKFTFDGFKLKDENQEEEDRLMQELIDHGYSVDVNETMPPGWEIGNIRV